MSRAICSERPKWRSGSAGLNVPNKHRFYGSVDINESKIWYLSKPRHFSTKFVNFFLRNLFRVARSRGKTNRLKRRGFCPRVNKSCVYKCVETSKPALILMSGIIRGWITVNLAARARKWRTCICWAWFFSCERGRRDCSAFSRSPEGIN